MKCSKTITSILDNISLQSQGNHFKKLEKIRHFDAVHLGSTGFPPPDPFADLYLLTEAGGSAEALSLTSLT